MRSDAAARTPEARLTLGFRLVTSRLPVAAELERLRAFQRQAKERYASHPAEAREALGLADGEKIDADAIERAAWTMVGNVLLNLDETLTKG